MTIFRRNRDELETRLRAARPEPREAFVHALVDHVSRHPRPRRPLAPRLALALAVTAAIAAVFGAFGGLGYAASAAAHAVAKANPVAIVHHASPIRTLSAQPNAAGKGKDDDDEASPSKDQYKPGKGCGDKNHVHARENECKKLK